MTLYRLSAAAVCLYAVLCGSTLAEQTGAPPKAERAAPLSGPPATLETIRPDISRDVAARTAKVACDDFAQDLWQWVDEKRSGENFHRIGAKMASVKIRERNGSVYPWGHGSYGESALGWGGQKLTGRFRVLFSDRIGSADGNRFAHGESDIQDVTLHKDGRVEIVLRSWGDTVLQLEDVTCYRDGFLSGIAREGNGVSLVSLAVRKEVATPESHPGSVWP